MEGWTDHIVKCNLYSSSLMPEFPTSSASRSFQPPGRPLSTIEATLSKMFMSRQWNPASLQSLVVHGHRGSGRSKESYMSPAILQEFAIVLAKFQG